MNNRKVAEMKIELEKLNRIEEIAFIVPLEFKEFTADFLQQEYQKITAARDKLYPTYKSEYRVIKTLIRLRNQLIYYIDTSYPDDRVQEIKLELVQIS